MNVLQLQVLRWQQISKFYMYFILVLLNLGGETLFAVNFEACQDYELLVGSTDSKPK